MVELSKTTICVVGRCVNQYTKRELYEFVWKILYYSKCCVLVPFPNLIKLPWFVTAMLTDMLTYLLGDENNDNSKNM